MSAGLGGSIPFYQGSAGNQTLQEVYDNQASGGAINWDLANNLTIRGTGSGDIVTFAYTSRVVQFANAPTSPGSGTDSEVWGSGADTTGSNSTIIGRNANGNFNNLLVLGINAEGTGNDATVIGADASGGQSDMILGSGASRTGAIQGNIGIGTNITVSAGTIGIGTSSTIAGTFGIGIGRSATLTSGSRTVAIGDAFSVTGSDNVFVGYNITTSASVSNCVLLGERVSSALSDVTAVGANISVTGTHTKSVTLGASATPAANELNIGAAGDVTTWRIGGRSDFAGSSTVHTLAQTIRLFASNAAGNPFEIDAGNGTGTGTPGYLRFSTYETVGSGTGFHTKRNRLSFDQAEAVFNEEGVDYNLRVEGSGEANLIFVDAGNDRVGISTNAPSTLFHVAGDGTVDGQLDIGSQGTEAGGINFNGTTYDTVAKISEIGGSLEAMLSIHRHSTTLPAGMITSRSNSADSTHGAVTASQVLWRQIHTGWTGSHYDVFAEIRALVDDSGTISATSSPGRLQLMTVPDGSNTPTVAIDIDNGQNVLCAADLEIDGDLNHDGSNLGVFNTAPTTQQTITGSRAGNAALASLLTGLAAYGLIVDSTTA